MKIKSNRNIIKGLISNSENELETYEMKKSILEKAELRFIRENNFHAATLARRMQKNIEESATWERGLIAGYKVSLTLIK